MVCVCVCVCVYLCLCVCLWLKLWDRQCIYVDAVTDVHICRTSLTRGWREEVLECRDSRVSMLSKHVLRYVARSHHPSCFRVVQRHSYSQKVSEPLRIMFCGSDEFSCASLRALHKEQQRDQDGILSIDVLCRPGKRTGRSLKTIREGGLHAIWILVSATDDRSPHQESRCWAGPHRAWEGHIYKVGCKSLLSGRGISTDKR